MTRKKKFIESLDTYDLCILIDLANDQKDRVEDNTQWQDMLDKIIMRAHNQIKIISENKTPYVWTKKRTGGYRGIRIGESRF